MEQLVGAKDWSECERHVCDAENCPGYVWPHLAKISWKDYAHDKCDLCGKARFDKRMQVRTTPHPKAGRLWGVFVT